jgi:hypothetical protein
MLAAVNIRNVERLAQGESIWHAGYREQAALSTTF